MTEPDGRSAGLRMFAKSLAGTFKDILPFALGSHGAPRRMTNTELRAVVEMLKAEDDMLLIHLGDLASALIATGEDTFPSPMQALGSRKLTKVLSSASMASLALGTSVSPFGSPKEIAPRQPPHAKPEGPQSAAQDAEPTAQPDIPGAADPDDCSSTTSAASPVRSEQAPSDAKLVQGQPEVAPSNSAAASMPESRRKSYLNSKEASERRASHFPERRMSRRTSQSGPTKLGGVRHHFSAGELAYLLRMKVGSDVDRAETIFMQCDKDASGVLDFDEFTSALRSLVSGNLPEQDIERLYDLMSGSNDEIIAGDFIDFFCSPTLSSRKKSSFPTGSIVVSCVAMSADQKFVAFGGANSSVQMYSIEKGDLVYQTKFECVFCVIARLTFVSPTNLSNLNDVLPLCIQETRHFCCSEREREIPWCRMHRGRGPVVEHIH